MSKTTRVLVNWVADDIYLLSDRNGFPVVMAPPPQGINGSDLLPLSLIGCAAWDVLGILRKQRQTITGLRVTADSEQDPDPPWRFRRISIHYAFRGANLNPEKIRRAIEISQEKYCSVYATLREAVTLDSRFEIVEDPARAAEPSLPLDRAQQVVIAFNDALNARDVDGMMQHLSEDCVFENTAPPPDGTRYEGRASVRAFWEQFFAGAPETHIEIEEIFGAGNRCVMRWVYRWTDAAGVSGHIRGIDLYTLRGGLIAEKLSYVKG